MRYERRKGDGAGLSALGLGLLLGVGAVITTKSHPSLWSAARWDGANAAFLILCVTALALAGNGLGILVVHRMAFAWRWWLLSLGLGLALGGLSLGFGWSMPLCLVLFGGGAMLVLELFELIGLPFEIAHGVLMLVRPAIRTVERALASHHESSSQ